VVNVPSYMQINDPRLRQLGHWDGVSYAGAQFIVRLVENLLLLKFYGIVLSPPGTFWGQYLKLGHECFLPHSSLLDSHYHPII